MDSTLENLDFSKFSIFWLIFEPHMTACTPIFNSILTHFNNFYYFHQVRSTLIIFLAYLIARNHKRNNFQINFSDAKIIDWRHAVNCQPGSRVMSSKHRASEHAQSLIFSLKTYTWMNFLIINVFNTQKSWFFKIFNFFTHFWASYDVTEPS